MMMGFAVVPFAPGMQIIDVNIGLLFFLGMTSLGGLQRAVGRLGVRTTSMRCWAGCARPRRMVSYEVFMGLSLMGVVMMSGSFSLVDIVAAQRDVWFCFSQALGLLVFVVAGIAESHRLPFDLPEAEHELTAGFHTEYGGMKFAMFMLGEYLGLMLISCMIVTLFFGGWMGPAAIAHWLPPLVWFGIKVCFVINFFRAVAGGDTATAIRPTDVAGLESHAADHAG